MTIWHNILLIGFGVFVSLISMLIGAYVMFKGKTSLPGENFIGGAPKGAVFSIPEASDVENLPDGNKDHVLEKAAKFLSVFKSP